MKDTAKKTQSTKQIVSIQIIHYCCANCSEEVEEVKFCPSCKAPMRVIQVTEKYGDEAEKFLEDLRGGNGSKVKTDVNLDSISSVAAQDTLVSEDDATESFDHVENTKKSEDDEWADMSNMDGIFDTVEDDAENASKKLPEGLDARELVDLLDKDEEGDLTAEDLEELKDL